MKKKELKLQKFTIVRLTNPYDFMGGTGGDTNTDLTTNTNSENTTYTTDPNVPCPAPGPPYTTNPTNTNKHVPTIPPPPTGDPANGGCP
jgi:hypothetical protein